MMAIDTMRSTNDQRIRLRYYFINPTNYFFNASCYIFDYLRAEPISFWALGTS